MVKSKAEKKSLGKENEKTRLREIKNVLQCDAFPGNLDLLSETLGGPVVPLVCGFIWRDNLQAWRQLITDLYKRKSRI